MSDAQIAQHARFDAIRYAQLWEDADVLLHGLGDQKGSTLVSICSAGDNALAMLTLDPAKVVTVDLSLAQLSCLKLRIAAFQTLNHQELLGLLGARRVDNRGELLDRVAEKLVPSEQAFWKSQRDAVVKFGAGGIGKFERYFRIFRRYMLPLTQNRSVIDEVFVSKPQSERAAFFEEKWDNWRWKLLLRFFFSNSVTGWLGRDPAFFSHVEGSLADHVGRRVKHAAIDLDPAQNPYLHWILRGGHNDALPLAWRREHFDVIRDRVNRLDLQHGALETFVQSGEKADGFNLSDIFEYMDESTFEAVYSSILSASKPDARLVFWNMMVPRRVPAKFASQVRTLDSVEREGKAMDKAFFYADFVTEQVK